MGRKWTTEKVRSRIESDLPGCKVVEGWKFKSTRERIPLLYQGWMYKISLSKWLERSRPHFNNLADPTGYVKFHIESDQKRPGCSVLNGWRYESLKKIPILYQGDLHEISWAKWQEDIPPCFSNLVDKTGYVRSTIESDSKTPGLKVDVNWEFVDARSKIPIWWNGWLYEISWSKWQENTRPYLGNMVDQTGFIKFSIENDLKTPGCRVLDGWKYKKSTEKIPILYKGNLYEICWTDWTSRDGCRPFFTNLVNKEKFIRKYCLNVNLVIPEDFSFKSGVTMFSVTLPDGSVRRTCWSHILSGKYPGSASYIILKRIETALSSLAQTGRKPKKRKSKEFSKMEIARTIADKVIQDIGGRPNVNYHLDHIVPVSFFDCGTLEYPNKNQIEYCWQTENLRWLEKSLNKRRSNNLTESEVAHMTDDQIAILRAASRRAEWGWTDSRIDAILAARKNSDAGQLQLNLLAATHVA